MKVLRPLFVFLFAGCVAAVVPGCSPGTGKTSAGAGKDSPGPAGAGARAATGGSWGAGSDGPVSRTENGVTTSYRVEYFYCDDRMYLVLATTGCEPAGGGGGGGKDWGQLHTTDGRNIAWSCSTPDGRSGKVVIDGREFDLAAGGLFLVSTKEMPTRVEQVAVDAG